MRLCQISFLALIAVVCPLETVAEWDHFVVAEIVIGVELVVLEMVDSGIAAAQLEVDGTTVVAIGSLVAVAAVA